MGQQPGIVLQNEYLMEHIFSYFEPEATYFADPLEFLYPGPDRSTRRALFFASLTCKSFVKPALDLLWRRMISITPVLKLLPTFVEVNNIYALNGAFQPTHMERLKMYGRKIRVLSIFIKSCPDSKSLLEPIAGQCIHPLSSIFNQQLFPALKALHITLDLLGYHKDQNVENFSSLFFAHGNLLTTITITFINSQNQPLVSSFLLHLSHNRASAIQEIGLSGHLSSKILDFLRVFRKLQTVRLSIHSSNFPISTVLQDLRDLPYLHYLYLRMNNSDLDDTTSLFSGETNGLRFQALQKLSLAGNQEKMLKILNLLRDRQGLRDISFYCDSTTNPYLSPIFFQHCIAEYCRIAPNLENFHLSTSREMTDSTSNTLAPFVRCRKLVCLRIVDIASPFNDDEIRELCESGAWRNLHNLYLPLPFNLGPSPSSTSLRVLAQNCRKLAYLTIPIDFRSNTPSSLEEERQYPRTGSHPLESLIIRKVNATNYVKDPNNTAQMAIAVARFLEHYFPKLDESNIHLLGYAQNDYQWWNMVRSSFTECRSLRAEAELDIGQSLDITM